jgi:hypothetical protein
MRYLQSASALEDSREHARVVGGRVHDDEQARRQVRRQGAHEPEQWLYSPGGGAYSYDVVRGHELSRRVWVRIRIGGRAARRVLSITSFVQLGRVLAGKNM